MIILVIVFSLLSGSGGFFYQNWDYNARNAVLNDLINFKWPVTYNYNSVDSKILGFDTGILSYYFTYWLPAAGIGKLLGIEAANIFLLLWHIFGLLLFFYFLARYLKKIKISYFFLFFAFSGMDILGRIIINLYEHKVFSITDFIGIEHIDTFGGYFCFSSFVTQVFWVFNQAIPAFIITMVLLNEKNYQNIGILMLFLVQFAPFPSLGLLYLIIIFVLWGFECQEKFSLHRIPHLITIQNICCFISVIPIALLFFQNAGNHNSGLIFFRDVNQNASFSSIMFNYLVLMILEVYCYIIIISNKNNKKILLLVGLFLSIIPFYYMGTGLDFCNRVCIPGQIILLCYVIKYFNTRHKNTNYKTVCLIIILLISSITGMNEVRRSLLYTKKNNINGISNITDNWKTYGTVKSKEVAYFIPNFVTPKKNNFYFKYILK